MSAEPGGEDTPGPRPAPARDPPRVPLLRNERHRTNLTVGAIFALFLALVAGMVALNVRATNAERNTALLVDITGRQGALTMRYANEVLLRAQGFRADPAPTRQQLEETAAVLLDGGLAPTPREGSDEKVRVPAAREWRLRKKLAQEKRLIGKLTKVGDQILAGGTGGAEAASCAGAPPIPAANEADAARTTGLMLDRPAARQRAATASASIFRTTSSIASGESTCRAIGKRIASSLPKCASSSLRISAPVASRS